jgi:hypothetical protein
MPTLEQNAARRERINKAGLEAERLYPAHGRRRGSRHRAIALVAPDASRSPQRSSLVIDLETMVERTHVELERFANLS